MDRLRLHPIPPVVLATAWALAAGSSPAAGQAGPPPTVRLSTDSIAMGEVFELQVSVAVPPGSIVYFPDTLPATLNMESAAPVRAESEETPGGGARLTLRYPMIAFGAGTLPVPGFDVLVVPKGARAGAGVLPGGSATGAWSDAPAREGSAGLIRIARQAVWVPPVFTPADFIEGIEPMPPNDVVGGNWSWPALALLLVSSSLLVVTLVSTANEWRSRRPGGGATYEQPTLEVRRLLALRQLDDLLAEGPHRRGALLDFYTRASGIVRSYVEAMDPDWSSSLTSGELMCRLTARSGEDSGGGLPTNMLTAEIVKFGRLRPVADLAERDWRAFRDWVDRSGAGLR